MPKTKTTTTIIVGCICTIDDSLYNDDDDDDEDDIKLPRFVFIIIINIKHMLNIFVCFFGCFFFLSAMKCFLPSIFDWLIYWCFKEARQKKLIIFLIVDSSSKDAFFVFLSIIKLIIRKNFWLYSSFFFVSSI